MSTGRGQLGNSMKAVLVAVGGLTAGPRTNSLLRTVTSFPGVLSASVDAGLHQVMVLFEPELVTNDDLRSMVVRAGIECVSISQGVVHHSCRVRSAGSRFEAMTGSVEVL